MQASVWWCVSRSAEIIVRRNKDLFLCIPSCDDLSISPNQFPVQFIGHIPVMAFDLSLQPSHVLEGTGMCCVAHVEQEALSWKPAARKPANCVGSVFQSFVPVSQVL